MLFINREQDMRNPALPRTGRRGRDTGTGGSLLYPHNKDAVSGKFALLALATLLSLMNQAGNVSMVKRQHITLSFGSVAAGHEL